MEQQQLILHPFRLVQTQTGPKSDRTTMEPRQLPQKETFSLGEGVHSGLLVMARPQAVLHPFKSEQTPDGFLVD
jgi:hypothetical protein